MLQTIDEFIVNYVYINHEDALHKDPTVYPTKPSKESQYAQMQRK